MEALAPSSSSAFQDFLETSSLVVLINWVVCSRSSSESQRFSASVGANAVCMFPCMWGKTGEHVLLFVSSNFSNKEESSADSFSHE